jgi:hypothetical protein
MNCWEPPPIKSFEPPVKMAEGSMDGNSIPSILHFLQIELYGVRDTEASLSVRKSGRNPVLCGPFLKS